MLPYGDLAAVRAVMSDKVAAVLVEPIQGEGGVVLPPEGFLTGLRALCDEFQALLVCDEIQSGLGRTGAMFAHTLGRHPRRRGHDRQGAVGGLYPVSAFLADDAVMDVFQPGNHGSTYGGNPLACAVAEAALDVLEDEDLFQRSTELGNWFIDQLRGLDSPHHQGSARRRALGSAWSCTSRPVGARRFCEELMHRGILCKETHTHTIRFAPPLVIERADLEWAVGEIVEVLS